MIFETIYKNIMRVFEKQTILYRPVSESLRKVLFITNSVLCCENCSMISFDNAGNKFIIIRSTEDKFVVDTIMYEGIPTVVVILPEFIWQIKYTNEDEYKRGMRCIYTMVYHVCNNSPSVCNSTITSSLAKILKLAPKVITVHIMNSIYFIEDDDINDLDNMELNVAKDELLNYTIGELLDNSIILNMIKG